MRRGGKEGECPSARGDVVQRPERRSHEPVAGGSSPPVSTCRARLAQPVEATAAEAVQSGFESRGGYHVSPLPWPNSAEATGSNPA
jgi:hypothetical protein